MSRLHSTQGRFAEQNPPLQLLLGLLSATGRVARLLPEPETERAEPSGPADPVVALLLGVVSFRRTLLQVLEPARAERRTPEASTPAEASLRDLLR